jgi:GNAT superfamily N-acetyltransferase
MMIAEPEITIRPFGTHDTEAVHRIGADTAHYGERVERIFDDRRMFIDIFLCPYTLYYADYCWVAEIDGEVIGYLTGCPDTASFTPRLHDALRAAAGRTLRGRYRIRWRTLRAGIAFVRELQRRPAMPTLRDYPAHLHLNLAAPYRGQGTGRRLMQAYLDQCRAAGLPGVHLTTSDQNRVALRLYAALGFQVLYCYSSPWHSAASRHPAEALVLGLRLSNRDS